MIVVPIEKLNIKLPVPGAFLKCERCSSEADFGVAREQGQPYRPMCEKHKDKFIKPYESI